MCSFNVGTREGGTGESKLSLGNDVTSGRLESPSALVSDTHLDVLLGSTEKISVWCLRTTSSRKCNIKLKYLGESYLLCLCNDSTHVVLSKYFSFLFGFPINQWMVRVSYDTKPSPAPSFFSKVKLHTTIYTLRQNRTN